MRRGAFAEKVRAVMAEMTEDGNREISLGSLFTPLDLVFKKDKKPLYTTLRDFQVTGEVVEVRDGVYIYKGKEAQAPDVRSKMWTVIRMKRVFTYEDLMELAGASRSYAKEFTQMLIKRGSVEAARKDGDIFLYRLVKDTGVSVPEDDEKAAKLRKIRESKKAANDLIDEAGKHLIAASQKLMAARIAVNDMPEVSNGDE